MSVFADSSALVKLYAEEADSEFVRGLNELIVAQLAMVEVPAALWRKERIGELSAAATAALVAEFEADFHGDESAPPKFAAVAADLSVLEQAARLTGSHGLRAYDAVQLACASAARRIDPDCTSLAVFDTALRRAAATEGFTLLPN